MSRLHNLYTQLITNRRADIDGWLRNYRAFTTDVGRIRGGLEAGRRLAEPAIYEGTAWAGEAEPWNAFAHALLREDNGVTSTGQSILSRDDLNAFLVDEDFVTSLEALIRTPSEIQFKAFAGAWDKLRRERNMNRNPLLINRTAAACTLDVSSTVNGSDFERVYMWLLDESLLPAEGRNVVGWYARNEFLMKHLRDKLGDMLTAEPTDDEHTLSTFVWQLRANLASPFELKKQIVRYGAPGTGKTFTAWRDTRLQFDIWKAEFGSATSFTHEACCQTVQFHPSYGYEDFLEGLRPILVGGRSQLALQNGVFKRLCITAGQWEKDVYKIPHEGPRLCQAWRTLTIDALRKHRTTLSGAHWDAIFDHEDGARLVDDAIPPFFLIIDEINRAELSRVFGELMICLEYRGPCNAILTQYASLNDKTTGMLEAGDSFKFFVPHNVYIIGTMNTVDRSVESFDLALRRRFSWQRIDPDIEFLRHHLRQHAPRFASLANRLAALNEQIRSHERLGPDYEIGHAYLMNFAYSNELSESAARGRLWRDSLGPLLEEYLRGSDTNEEQLKKFKSIFVA